MANHNSETATEFKLNTRGCENFNEQQLLEAVNKTVVRVELDDDYSTKQKLNIYSMMTTLSNCSESERKKYAKKVYKLL